MKLINFIPLLDNVFGWVRLNVVGGVGGGEGEVGGREQIKHTPVIMLFT